MGTNRIYNNMSKKSGFHRGFYDYSWVQKLGGNTCIALTILHIGTSDIVWYIDYSIGLSLCNCDVQLPNNSDGKASWKAAESPGTQPIQPKGMRNPQMRHCHTCSTCSHSHLTNHTHTQLKVLYTDSNSLPDIHIHTHLFTLTLIHSHSHLFGLSTLKVM